MKCAVTASTLYTKHLLQNHAGTSGTIHSVYRKTINIMAGDQLLALQAAGSPLSPISLITDLTPAEMEALSAVPGDTVRFYPDHLEVNSPGSGGTDMCCTFTLTDCTFHDTLLTAVLPPSSLDRLTENVQLAVALANTNGFDMIFNHRITDSAPLMILAARDRIQKCSALCTDGKYEEAGTELARLIGLGIGLTPSGDDFLCGVLAGLRLSGSIEHPLAISLKEAVHAHLSDTVDVSAAFLSCALKGEFSLAVNKLTSLPSPEQLVRTFSDIGHSSGIDTLCGVLYALRLSNRRI